MEDHRREVRSFVIRAARTSTGQKRALSELYPLYGWNFPLDEGVLATFRGAFARFVIEIGFGNGEATIEIAQKNPETAFLGVEVHPPGVGRLLMAIHERGLRNLRVLRWDAVEVLHALPLAGVDGFHVFFPDPWPKKRHQKRRLLQKSFVERMTALLKPGGYIYVATDWEEYAQEVLELLSQTPGLENPYRGYAEGLLWRPETKFERRGREENRPIREIYFLKRRPA